MKLEIYQPTRKEPEPSPIFLKLVSRNDCVHVVACHSDGSEHSGGYLLKFLPDGTVQRFICVNGSLGFQLNSSGSIIIGDIL